MDIHILIRPKSRTTPNEILKAGSIQLSEWRGNLLQTKTTATLWWKRKYIHARANHTTSFIELEVIPNQSTRLLHFGFTIELSRGNKSLVKADFEHDSSLGLGFNICINLEKILAPHNVRANQPRIVVLKKPIRHFPSTFESY